MKKLLLTAVAAMALGASTAKAGTWWIYDSRIGACVAAPAAYPSPLALAAEMRQEGRLDALTDQKWTPYGTAYGVHYDGVVAPYFVAKDGCEYFLTSPRAFGRLP
jgi:hypothetical protein